ncbi:ABC transporter ATP-binding protein [Schinkia azotoformans]|uniref:ABC transporter ATP-binding protein n=1 Tax=Schinkia azotoformans TaxID=1454 RepID=UPI002DB7B458|nr:ABC transporter ATP-binding protein [Schinkia azotoformans]MEC1778062.1 ABC transporter ATP-binding protein [Schinkia azotoformans]MED4328122.1 ABC transporter ATP-binding protein [Schinkia azotoformans]
MRTLFSLKWIIPFIKPYRVVLAFIILVAICSTTLSLSYPFLSKILIDDVLINNKYELQTVLLIGVGMMMTGVLLQAVNSFIYLRITLLILKSLRVDFFGRIQRNVYDFFIRNKVGDITTRLNGDLNEIQSFVTDGALQFITNLLTLSFITGMLLFLDWKLFLYALIFIPVLLGSLLYFRPKIINWTRKIREHHSDIQAHMIETFSNIRLIKLSAAEEQQGEKLNQKIIRLNRDTLSLSIIQSLAEGIPRTAIGFSTGFVFLVGGSNVIDESMTLGSLLAFITYLGRFYSPIQSLAGLYLRFQRVRVSVDRIHEFIYNSEKEDTKTKETVSYGTKGISYDFTLLEYNQVSKWTGTAGQTLINVNLNLRPNAIAALIGPSGAGKTTLVDTMVRLTPITGGTIRFQGEDISEIPLSRLRREIVIVSQEQEMLNGTIIDNLLIGFSDLEKRQLTQAEIERCCEQTGILGVIQSLPDQFETVVGQRGKRLSGGEKQRLAIAGALLKNPVLLILDEATSGLDQISERQLFLALKEWMGTGPMGKGILIISHRLSSMKLMDQILLFEDGQVVDQGKHGALEERSILYQELVKSEFKREVPANFD